MKSFGKKPDKSSDGQTDDKGSEKSFWTFGPKSQTKSFYHR